MESRRAGKRASMNALRIAIGLALAAWPAAAAPVPDLVPWARDFTRSALANDPDAMLAEVRDIAHPGFNVDALRGIFQRLDSIVGTQPGDYAEQFDERNVGTFLKRINVAVHYPKSYLFYSITFSRDPRVG